MIKLKTIFYINIEQALKDLLNTIMDYNFRAYEEFFLPDYDELYFIVSGTNKEIINKCFELKYKYPLSTIFAATQENKISSIVEIVKSGADFVSDFKSLEEILSMFENASRHNIDINTALQWKAIIDTLPLIALIKNTKTQKYVSLNVYGEKYFSITSKEVSLSKYNYNFSRLLEEIESTESEFILSGKQSFTENIALKLLDQQTKNIELTKYPIIINEQIRYILYLGIDIPAANNDSNLLKSKLMSILSHEFRTPLTTIMLSSDLLRRYSDNWSIEEKDKHFDRIKKTVLSMTKMIEDILNISKLESGQFKPHKENIDFPSFCKAIAEGIEYSKNSETKINFTCSGTCVNTPIEETLTGLIITNLLSNAVKYSPNHKQVDFILLLNDKCAVIEIQDRGIGIPEDELPRLFDLFHRASNVGNINGYGLGLALVKQCADLLGASIKVSSQVNLGTKFIVTIPF